MDPGNVYVPKSEYSLDAIEMPFYYLGLNTTWKRFIAGSTITGGFLFLTKPSSLFTEDGTPRPWRLTSHDAEATIVPWWFYSLGVGVILGTFI